MSERSNKRSAIIVSACVGAMFGLSFAAFPLYNLFCRVTGYGGTPQISENISSTLGTKNIEIRFNADISPNVPWQFVPMQKSVKVVAGENKMAFYKSKNYSDHAVTGIATYNVVPEKAAYYFNKVQCFCFNEQTLQAGEEVEMPVSFYVDPEFETDPEMSDVTTITLSYTFFEAKK